jgi:hypothetical protein
MQYVLCPHISIRTFYYLGHYIFYLGRKFKKNSLLSNVSRRRDETTHVECPCNFSKEWYEYHERNLSAIE